jgi:hypothetical protein
MARNCISMSGKTISVHLVNAIPVHWTFDLRSVVAPVQRSG